LIGTLDGSPQIIEAYVPAKPERFFTVEKYQNGGDAEYAVLSGNFTLLNRVAVVHLHVRKVFREHIPDFGL
jgi:hypothetical protein